jgi:alkylhydroperoxidase family enzyme
LTPFFSSLDSDSGVRDILTLNPAAGKALIEYHEAVLRGPSPLSEGERELIAAYVSGLNACHYCHGVHTKTPRPSALKKACCRSCSTIPRPRPSMAS